MLISHVLMPVTGPGLCQVICAFTSCTVTLCGSGCAAFPILFTLILEHWSPESTGQAVRGVWLFPGFQQHQDSQDISSFPLLSRRLVDTSTAVVMCRMKLGIFPLPWKPGCWRGFAGLLGPSVSYQCFCPNYCFFISTLSISQPYVGD